MPKTVYTVKPVEKDVLSNEEKYNEWSTHFDTLFSSYAEMPFLGISLWNANEMTGRPQIVSFKDIAIAYYEYLNNGKAKDLFANFPESAMKGIETIYKYMGGEVSIEEYLKTLVDLHETFLPEIEKKLPKVAEGVELFDNETGLSDPALKVFAEKNNLSEMEYAMYVGLRAFEKVPIYEELMPKSWKVMDPEKESEIHNKPFKLNVLPEGTEYDDPSVELAAKQYIGKLQEQFGDNYFERLNDLRAWAMSMIDKGLLGGSLKETVSLLDAAIEISKNGSFINDKKEIIDEKEVQEKEDQYTLGKVLTNGAFYATQELVNGYKWLKEDMPFAPTEKITSHEQAFGMLKTLQDLTLELPFTKDKAEAIAESKKHVNLFTGKQDSISELVDFVPKKMKDAYLGHDYVIDPESHSAQDAINDKVIISGVYAENMRSEGSWFKTYSKEFMENLQKLNDGVTEYLKQKCGINGTKDQVMDEFIKMKGSDPDPYIKKLCKFCVDANNLYIQCEKDKEKNKEEETISYETANELRDFISDMAVLINSDEYQEHKSELIDAKNINSPTLGDSFKVVTEAIPDMLEPAQNFGDDIAQFIEDAEKYVQEKGNVGNFDKVIASAKSFKESFDKEGYSAKTADLFADLAANANVLFESSAYKNAKANDPNISELCNPVGSIFEMLDNVPLTEAGVEKIAAQVKLSDTFAEKAEENKYNFKSLPEESEKFINTIDHYIKTKGEKTTLPYLLQSLKDLNEGLKDGLNDKTADLAAKFINESKFLLRSDEFIIEEEAPELLKEITPFLKTFGSTLEDLEYPGKSLAKRCADPANQSLAEKEARELTQEEIIENQQQEEVKEEVKEEDKIENVQPEPEKSADPTLNDLVSAAFEKNVKKQYGEKEVPKNLSEAADNYIKTTEDYLRNQNYVPELAFVLGSFKNLNEEVKNGFGENTLSSAAKLMNDYNLYTKSKFFNNNKNNEPSYRKFIEDTQKFIRPYVISLNGIKFPEGDLYQAMNLPENQHTQEQIEEERARIEQERLMNQQKEEIKQEEPEKQFEQQPKVDEMNPNPEAQQGEIAPDDDMIEEPANEMDMAQYNFYYNYRQKAVVHGGEVKNYPEKAQMFIQEAEAFVKNKEWEDAVYFERTLNAFKAFNEELSQNGFTEKAANLSAKFINEYKELNDIAFWTYAPLGDSQTFLDDVVGSMREIQYPSKSLNDRLSDRDNLSAAKLEELVLKEEADRREQERLENERIQREQREKEERDRLEQERLEQERLRQEEEARRRQEEEQRIAQEQAEREQRENYAKEALQMMDQHKQQIEQEVNAQNNPDREQMNINLEANEGAVDQNQPENIEQEAQQEIQNNPIQEAENHRALLEYGQKANEYNSRFFLVRWFSFTLRGEKNALHDQLAANGYSERSLKIAEAGFKSYKALNKALSGEQQLDAKEIEAARAAIENLDATKTDREKQKYANYMQQITAKIETAEEALHGQPVNQERYEQMNVNEVNNNEHLPEEYIPENENDLDKNKNPEMVPQ